MTTSDTKREYGYYRCSGTPSGVTKLQEKCCALGVPTTIEDLVWHDVRGFIEDPGDIIAPLQRRISERYATTASDDGELAQVEAALASKRDERGRIISLHRKGIISEVEAEQE